MLVSSVVITRYTSAAVTSYRAINLTIANCSFTQHSNEAVLLIGVASGVLFTGNSISSSGRGFTANVRSDPATAPVRVLNNTLSFIGMLPGFGPPGIDGAIGIQLDGDGAVTSFNALVSAYAQSLRYRS